MKFLFIIMLSLISLNLRGQVEDGKILISRFSVQELNSASIKINVEAESIHPIKIGSYVVSVQGVNEGKEITEIKGLKRVNDMFYMVSQDFLSNELLIKDNGEHDIDKTKGKVSIILSTEGWSNGIYDIRVSATNRPAIGKYVAGKEMYRYVVGEKSKSVPTRLKMNHQIIWSDSNYYAYFPTLTQLEDKSLVTRFATRVNPSHIDTAGGVKTMVSKDLGVTWFQAKTNFSISEVPNKDGTMINVTGGGWMYQNSNKETQSKDRANAKNIVQIDNDREAYVGKNLIINTSYNSGKTWIKKKFDVPKDILDLFRFSTFRSTTGLRIIGLYGTRKTVKGKTNSEIFFLRSVDDGMNWDFVYLTPLGMNDPTLNPSESSIIQTKNGKLLVLFRTSESIYSSISHDQGKTWTTPKDTAIEGCPPFLLQLKDGRLICFYGYRNNPMGIRATISYDNGNTWDTKNEIILREDGFSFDPGNLGYPRAVELENGDIYVVYYFTINGKTPFIAGTRFRLN